MRLLNPGVGHARPTGRCRIVLGAIGLALLLGLGSVSAGGPQPVQAARAYEFDLYRPGDFVSQTNLVQCVGASMQMMINLVTAQDDRSAATQRRLWQLARELGPPRPPDRPPSRGASVQGWAAGLNQLDQGPYAVVGYPSLADALHTAARAIRRTGRPVGLLVWGGRHAWVMSGFRATADPAVTDNFRVTHAIVLDPLHPLHSIAWGRSPAPGSSLTPAGLGHYFVPRRRGWSGELSGTWVIVQPVDPQLRPGML
jgi:hypothetical protein